jgi:V-type H+-transporting ATPase proteolipid subunit
VNCFISSKEIIDSILFKAMGAAYGTAKSGCGISAMAVMRPEFIMKSVIPVVMAGIIAIYGLVVAVLIANNISAENYGLYKYENILVLFFFDLNNKSF